ncbi:MAG: LptE family protein [Tenacibaculum sp.]|nr:LptE family protein [Tenacibaculum sp.]
MKKIIYILLFAFSFVLISCGVYSFSGGNTGDAKTIQVDFFRNQASIVEPTLSQLFTQKMQDMFTRRTNLTLVKTNGDLHFEGEITGYHIAPMSATANETAALNRLTVTVNVRYYNRLDEKSNFEKQFSFYETFPANQNLTGGTLESVLEVILERITQDIFNESVAKW